ncbi:MAG: GspE/PulE family protein [Candidatus Polarisedimenticolaceae bacterium]|nr:GspE/PulE family protein [Candidatus Polarisedimenticolaceae bacterium]
MKKIRIGDLLVQQGKITNLQLEEALVDQKKSGRKLGRALIDLGYIDESELNHFLSRQLNIPFIDLTKHKLSTEVVQKLPEMSARRFRVIVLDETPSAFIVGMVDPTDMFAHDELARILKRTIKPALVCEQHLLRSIDMLYRRTDEIMDLAGELGDELAEGDIDLARLVSSDEVTDAPVVKLLQKLFEDAVQVGASDIHIEPDEKVLRIRQRVDGVLHEHVMNEKQIAPALILRLKLISGLNISEKRLPQDGRFHIRVKNQKIDVRLSTMPIQHGESAVMRLLNQSSGIIELDNMGLDARFLKQLRRLVHHPHGMVLVTGPTGSGKTTSLYGVLNELNKPDTKIITVEDPVEYRLPRINQVQVNSGIGLTFSSVLRATLRQDPDIILVGEMRDQETAEIGLRAAMTGHLVLSTLHTNDAISTANRLFDLGAEGYLLAASLLGIVAQRLVRKVCDGCAEPYEPDAHEQAWLKTMLGEEEYEGFKMMKGAGCQYCNQSGYRGRFGIYEILEIDKELADALSRGDLEMFANKAQKSPGYRPLLRAALDSVATGMTTLDEVFRIAGEIKDSDTATEELLEHELELQLKQSEG